MPYAGFFSEEMKRDEYIKINNKKNKIESYEEFCKKNKITLLKLNKYQLFEFKGEKLLNSKIIRNNPKLIFDNLKYFKQIKSNYDKIQYKYIKEYFLKSKYLDNLILYISLSNDDFKKTYKIFKVDFSNQIIKFSSAKKINFLNKKKKYLHFNVPFRFFFIYYL